MGDQPALEDFTRGLYGFEHRDGPPEGIRTAERSPAATRPARDRDKQRHGCGRANPYLAPLDYR